MGDRHILIQQELIMTATQLADWLYAFKRGEIDGYGLALAIEALIEARIKALTKKGK